MLGQVGQAEIHPKDQQAAMWAAANVEQFDEARAGYSAGWCEYLSRRLVYQTRNAAISNPPTGAIKSASAFMVPAS